MSALLDVLKDHPVHDYAAGQTVIEQNDATGALYILITGSVEIVKDDILVAKSADPGAIFGDLAALLGVPHTASVRTLMPSTFHILPDARSILRDHPRLCLHLCEVLATRLDSVNKYLVDVKKQFVGHDHLSMVDQVLDALMHRHPRPRITPRVSTLQNPEVLD